MISRSRASRAARARVARKSRTARSITSDRLEDFASSSTCRSRSSESVTDVFTFITPLSYPAPHPLSSGEVRELRDRLGSGRRGDAAHGRGGELRGGVRGLARGPSGAAEQALGAAQGLARGLVDPLHRLAREAEAGRIELLGQVDALLDHHAELDPRVLQHGDRRGLPLVGDIDREVYDAGQDAVAGSRGVDLRGG